MKYQSIKVLEEEGSIRKNVIICDFIVFYGSLRALKVIYRYG